MPTLSTKQKQEAIASIWSNDSKLKVAIYLRENSPCNPTQIENACKLSSPHVSRILKEMINTGTIERSPYTEEDTRLKFYRLTLLGKKIINFLD